MRTFVFTDDKSNKFWNIDVQGSRFTVTFGKPGSKGQTQVKEFADAQAAQKEHDQLIAEKIRKGYKETTSAAPAQKSAAAESSGRAGKGKSARTTPASQQKAESPRKETRTFTHPRDGGAFWSIELDGTSFTVTSGRIGEAGEAETKTFADEATARRAYDKLVAEKLDRRRQPWYHEVLVKELADPTCERVFVRRRTYQSWWPPAPPLASGTSPRTERP